MNKPDQTLNALESIVLDSSSNSVSNTSINNISPLQKSKKKTESDLKNRRKSMDHLSIESIKQSNKKGNHKIDSSLTFNNQNIEPKSASIID